MEYNLSLKFKNKIFKGILINEDENFLTLKLSSGYNANFKKENIQILKKEKLNFDNQNKDENIFNLDNKDKKDLPKIALIHTGGTIASKVDYRTGAVNPTFTKDEIMNLFSDLNKKANILTSMVFNIFSEDLRFREYNILIKEVNKIILENKDLAGIIISHGTDTMHYSANALFYALKNLNCPIIFVGAQRSSDRASSDSFFNLNCAIDFINYNFKKNLAFRRVGICMHSRISDNQFYILDAINSKKMHSTRRDAFKQINYLPFAKIEYDFNLKENNFKIEILRSDLLSKKSSKNLSFNLFDCNLKIGFLKVHPNLFCEEIEMMKFYDCVILEGTGVGNIGKHLDNNLKDEKLFLALIDLCKKTKVIACVQTVYGEVSLDIYSRGRDIQKAKVIGNRHNFISETCFIRSAYILSLKNLDKSFEQIWEENLEDFKIDFKDI